MEGKLRDGFKDDGKLKVLTIPNVLSMLRLFMIPLFLWTYIGKDDPQATFYLLLISGFTDVIDGFIARKFNMISAFGKALDPIADKLTQIAMLLCLVSKFPPIWIPFVLLVIKEFFSGVAVLVAIKRTGKVHGADWHGKVTTVLIYAMGVLHVLWTNIPKGVSHLLVSACVIMMLISFVLYSKRSIGMARNASRESKESEEI
ncbi:MAG: CDP-alcohol phosphatidyltransferase family protein [Clostridia bacterium]|nr:CDP-alcohol phosphatidyltransferase family protein [Clostridia bacterium]